MENNQEEPKVYRPRTGSMERKKTAAAATGDAELPADGAEPKPRARAHTEDEEQPAGRATARQSFFKNRTSPSEAYPADAADAGFNPKPRRAPRAQCKCFQRQSGLDKV